MTLQNPDDPVRYQALMKAYFSLNDTDQAVINLLAVNWAPLGSTAIKSALGLTSKNRLKLSSLEKQGMITPPNYQGFGPRPSGMVCHPDIIEPVARHLVKEGFFERFVALARGAWPLIQHATSTHRDREALLFQSPDQLIREVRIGLYLGDEEYISLIYNDFRRYSYRYWGQFWQRWADPESIYTLICLNPFEIEWFKGLPEGFRRAILPNLTETLTLEWRFGNEIYDHLFHQCQALGSHPSGLSLASLLRGEMASATSQVKATPLQPDTEAIAGLRHFLSGDLNAGIKRFEKALRLHRKLAGKRKVFLPGLGGVFYILALSLRNQGEDIQQARSLIRLVSTRRPFAEMFRLLHLSLNLEQDRTNALEEYRKLLTEELSAPDFNPWLAWIGLLQFARYVDDAAMLKPFRVPLVKLRERAQSLGWRWLVAELNALLTRYDTRTKAPADELESFRQQSDITLLADHVHYQAPWERALNAICNAAPIAAIGRTTDSPAVPELRLAWLLDEDYQGYTVEVREQKRSGQRWTKGKPISLKNLRETAHDRPYLQPCDHQVIAHIVQESYGRPYRLSEHGWLALAGHPALFCEDNGQPVEVVLAPPELRIRKPNSGEVRIEFWPKGCLDQTLVFTQEGVHRLKLTEIKPEHHRLAQIIGTGIDAPISAQTRILEGLSSVSSLVAIHSDIGTPVAMGGESVAANSLPRVQLAPESEGLKVAILIRPFGDRGAYYPPGAGGAGLIAEIEGERLQTQRDLKLERQRVAELIEICPSLEQGADPIKPFHWLMESTEESLSFLLEIQAAGEEKAVVEWPQGETFQVVGRAELSQMSLQIQQQRDWFSINGELKLNNGEVIQMQTLLTLIQGQKGRFVRLDENRFLALTDSFRKRLEDLSAFSEKHRQEQRIHPLALSALNELADEFGNVQTDAAWRQRIDQLRTAQQLQPKLPSTLQAELRDYQHEGFIWLSRLASWGVGACLADDMGLGKTVQAIALILSRAGEGPTLVIAPTSVTFNWSHEITRFAPTLNLKTLSGDRQQVIDQIGPLDILICSYGLLQQEAVGEALARVNWRTLVLDEAQAIKNAATRRSQQAMALQADFKLITTGTPVENHLGELWNLFRFINPGLLGSLESFNRRFAGPIERNQDRETRQRLKRLILPFILRRTKTQVLEELPSRTEIDLQVELSEAEAAFYEALRRNLLAQLEESGGPIEDQRFQVLAAITKLRRACCNPNLVAPELGLSSSKLSLLGEVLEELLDNRHKALIFSQFVDHLSLVRAHLDEKGVFYQYLDGKTPAPERKKRVEAFQRGEGDVFLISLKAGGTGLNLTAADYVIHLDPWWNPAVEDQASDRAHRMGQTRPVTIYRLVAKGTIEEQIVSLHRQKRELADSLLDGGEISAKLKAEDLLQLMHDSA